MTDAERAAHFQALLVHPGFTELEAMAKERAFSAFVQSEDADNMAKTVAEHRAVRRLRQLAENFVSDISAKG